MNIVEKCSREIERVTVLREQYYGTAVVLRQRDPDDDLAAIKPAITLMTAAIESGHTALGSGDAVAVIAAIHELEGFRE